MATRKQSQIAQLKAHIAEIEYQRQKEREGAQEAPQVIANLIKANKKLEEEKKILNQEIAEQRTKDKAIRAELANSSEEWPISNLKFYIGLVDSIIDKQNSELDHLKAARAEADYKYARHALSCKSLKQELPDLLDDEVPEKIEETIDRLYISQNDRAAAEGYAQQLERGLQSRNSVIQLFKLLAKSDSEKALVDLTVDNQALAAKIQDYEQELKDYQQELQELRSRNEQLERDAKQELFESSSESSPKKRKLANGQNVSQVNALQNQLNSLYQENKKLRQELNQADSSDVELEVSALQIELNTLKLENDELKLGTTALDEQFKSEQARWQEADANQSQHVVNSMQRITELEYANAASQNNFDSLKAKYTEQTQQLNAVKHRVVAEQKRIADIQKEMKKDDDEHKRQIAEIEAWAAAQAEELNENIDAQKNAVETLKNQLRWLKDEHSRLLGDMQQLINTSAAHSQAYEVQAQGYQAQSEAQAHAYLAQEYSPMAIHDHIKFEELENLQQILDGEREKMSELKKQLKKKEGYQKRVESPLNIRNPQGEALEKYAFNSGNNQIPELQRLPDVERGPSKLQLQDQAQGHKSMTDAMQESLDDSARHIAELEEALRAARSNKASHSIGDNREKIASLRRKNERLNSQIRLAKNHYRNLELEKRRHDQLRKCIQRRRDTAAAT